MKEYDNISRFELKANKSEFESVQITNSKQAAEFIRQFYGDDISIYESFFILLLNRTNKTIGYAKISQGGTAGTVVDFKIIAKYAIDSLASSIILAHNHPSNSTTPSESDKKLTSKIKKGLELLEIYVADHIILTEDSYLSFGDEGLI